MHVYFRVSTEVMQYARADLQVLQQTRDVVLVRAEDVVNERHGLLEERLHEYAPALTVEKQTTDVVHAHELLPELSCKQLYRKCC